MIGIDSQGRLARISREPVTVALLVCLTVFGTLSWLRSGGHLQISNADRIRFISAVIAPVGANRYTDCAGYDH